MITSAPSWVWIAGASIATLKAAFEMAVETKWGE